MSMEMEMEMDMLALDMEMHSKCLLVQIGAWRNFVQGEIDRM
jgi:hypothetical protein